MSTPIVPFRQDESEQYFRLRPGGESDYDNIMISGMSGHLPRKNGLIQYERSGPFMPPMCFPNGEIIVVERMYRDLSASEFSDFRAQPVMKAHICRTDWDGVVPVEHYWGEPEDQILDRPHDPECAAVLGDLYEIILPVHGSWKSIEHNSDWTECRMMCPSFSGGDFFALQNPNPRSTTAMCSTRFRRWLEDDGAARWITFMPATIIRS